MTKLTRGHQYRIKQVPTQVDRRFRCKLLSLGLIPGAQFRISRVAPLGDPFEIHIQGASISMRQRELEAFILEDVS